MANILLVDDEESVLQSLGALLRSHGYDVTAEQDGAKSAELIRARQFDAILTDIRMSPVDGMQLIQIARQAQPETPIIVISAYCSEKTVRQSYQLGCSAYIKKPFTIRQVLETVEKALAAV